MPHGETFNVYTHLFGALLALGGMVFLIVHSSLYQDAWKIVSVSIYGSALFLLYLVSTLYHTISPGKWKDRFQVLDHCAIYILIAASYTPYTLVTLNEIGRASCRERGWRYGVGGGHEKK